MGEKHRELTGVTNEVILDNLKKINSFGVPITIRTPVVPGSNDAVENIQAIAEFIKDLSSVKEYELLPYHNLGESKYKALGRKYELEEVNPPEDEFIRERVKIANKVLKPCGKRMFLHKEKMQGKLSCNGYEITPYKHIKEAKGVKNVIGKNSKIK